MHSRATRRASDEGQGDHVHVPAELHQTSQQTAAPFEHAKRIRTKSRRRDVSLRDQSRQVSGNINEQSEEALDMEFLRKEADLENLLQVNQKLGRMQLVAHRDLLFVHERIGKYQADCHCLEAQNQYLQQHIMTLAAGMRNPGEGADDADACSEASSAELMQMPSN